jgi:hypothetical protein
MLGTRSEYAESVLLVSYSGPIRLTPVITAHAVHCTGLHPSLDPGEQTIIWMITCAPLTFPEDLKLLLKEGLAKLCPHGIVPREYEALQLCMSRGNPEFMATTYWSAFLHSRGHIYASGMYRCSSQTSSRSPCQMSTRSTSPPSGLPLRRKPWTPQGTNAQQGKWPPTSRVVSAQSPSRAERRKN